MSQMPEMPAAGWAEQGYDPSAYPQQAETQSAQNHSAQVHHGQTQTAAVWQQDTEPDWGASQQGYPEQDYAGNGYQPQGQGQEYPGYPAQQGYPTQAVQAAAAAAEQSSGTGLPTEFDHLFRDSTPDSRRAIDRQKPGIGGAGPVPSAAPEAPFQAYQQQPQQPPAEQFPGPAQYQGPQHQGAQFQSGPGPYPQGAGYGEPERAFGGGNGGGGFGSGGFGGGPAGGAMRNRRTLVIGGAVALAAIIGIVIATSSSSPGGRANASTGGGTPSTAPSKTSPKQQADQIYQLIQQSSQLRSDANTAVVDVNGCKDLATAQSLLTSTAQKRQAQADGVDKLDVSGIQNGAQLVGQLKAAWTASSQYDTAYAQIAGDMQGGCKAAEVRKDSNYQAANQAAGSADDAKAQAAQLWNDNVATPLGESQVTSDKL